MSTVLVLCVPLHGHLNPTLPVAAELVRRGVRVVYACTAPFRDAIERAGARFIDLGAHLPAPSPPTLLTCANAWLTFTLRHLSALERLVHDLAPDLVVNDFICLWGRALAERLGLATVTTWSTFAWHPDVLPPEPFLTLSQLRPPRRALAQLRHFHTLAHALAARTGRPALTPRDVLTGARSDTHIVFTWRALQPHPERFSPDQGWNFVGPALPRAHEPAPDAELARLLEHRDRPLVYVSAGTLYNNDPRFFRRAIDVLRHFDGRVIVSLGDADRATDDAWRELPPHITVRAFVPQLSVLQHASAFLTHGGMNSVNEAVFCGTPMVVSPRGADQFTVAHQVERCGLGRWIKSPWLFPHQLLDTLEAVIHSTATRIRCQRLRDELTPGFGAPRHAAELILQSLAAPRPRRPDARQRHVTRCEP